MTRLEDNELHDRLFAYLKEKNLPCPDILQEEKSYHREVAVGWIILGMKPLPMVTREELDRELKAKLSRKYGFMKPNSLKFIDYICEIFDEIWIIEGKRKLNCEAIGQIITYSDLFSLDWPGLKIRRAIICEESDFLLENICKKNDIEVFVVK